jgi:hypothetical protein
MMTEVARPAETPSCSGVWGVDVWLIEINSSPALAEHLLPTFVDRLIERVIDPHFPAAPSPEDNSLQQTIGEITDILSACSVIMLCIPSSSSSSKNVQ